MADNGLTRMPRIRKLRSLTDIGREIESLYKQTRHNKLSTQDMSRYVAALNLLAGVIKDDRAETEIADRLAALEDLHG